MKDQTKLKEQFLDQLSKTPIVQIVCEKLSVSRATFYRWKIEDYEFTKKVNEAIFSGRLLVNDLAENQLIRAVKDRNLNAVFYWLRHHHEAYGNKIEIEAKINSLQDLTEDQRKLIEKALEYADFSLNTYAQQNLSDINQNNNQAGISSDCQ